MGVFTEDLAAGEGVELEVVARLEKYWGPRGYLPILKEGEKGHDIRLVHPSERPILIEVKYDRESQRTGNIAIEFQCSGKWSGIATTKADAWAFKYWDRDAWHYRVVLTEKLTEAWRSKRFRAVYGGDECRARLILVPVRALSTWGIAL
jgi:hypothetical protein